MWCGATVETLRSVLRERNVTFQRTRSWKRSTDSLFEDKATRMALYGTCPADGVVVCFDEFGPISLQPYPGHRYATTNEPPTCGEAGMGYFFGAYEVHADVLFGGYRLAKTTNEVLPCTNTSAVAIPITCASIWSTTTCRCTGRRRFASGPSRTTSSWCRRQPPPATSIVSSVSFNPCANSC